MAGRRQEELRREIGAERQLLTDAVRTLRAAVADATDVRARLREHLPLAATGAAALGFVATGGLRATARLLLRRRSEPKAKAKAGRFAVLDRR